MLEIGENLVVQNNFEHLPETGRWDTGCPFRGPRLIMHTQKKQVSYKKPPEVREKTRGGTESSL